MNRIVITGVSGSGKTTLGKRIREILPFELLDFDNVMWLENWQRISDEELEKHVSDFVNSHHQWIISGDWRGCRQITWPPADTLLWLDYPLWVNFNRQFRRTARRVVSGERLWGTNNRMSWRALFSLRSPILGPVRRHWRRRREIFQLLAQPEHQHLTVLRHRSPDETERFLEMLAETAKTQSL